MPYTITYLEELEIIEIVNTGKVSFEEFTKQSEEVLTLAREKQTNLLLSDISQLELELSAHDIYSFPKLWDDIGAPRTNKLAMFLPQGDTSREDFSFYENVTRNRGWQVQFFAEKDKALVWLQGLREKV